jgi:GAF domain-containing protein
MSGTALEEYQGLVEAQARSLLRVLQSVAMGDLDVEAEVPEGIEVLSDLAVGINIMIDDVRAMMGERVRADVVEKQSLALLDAVQSVALGNLDVEVDVPEGVEVLSELAVGIEMMVDDLREMLAEQERVRAEIEAGQQQLEKALQEVLAVQRRYVQQQWEDYATGESALGYVLGPEREGPAGDIWLPAMSDAVQQADTVVERRAGAGASLALPIKLYDEVIGALGFRREEDQPWHEDDITAIEAVVEQIAWALENQRLFDEEQQARALLGLRVNELDCLNDIGHTVDTAPPTGEFLDWVAGRIPSAMQHPDLCRVAIEFEDRVYGASEALDLSRQMMQGLRVGDRWMGRICIAYTEELDFLNEESALLGDIARRVGGYIENRRLFEQTQVALRESEILLRITQNLARMENPQEMFEFVLPEYLRLLELPQGGLLIHDEDGRYGTLRALVQGGQLVESGMRIPIVGNQPMEQMLATKKPVVINDALHSELGRVAENLASDLDYQSLLLVPIMVGGKVIGTLGADSTETTHDFSDREVALIQSVANQLATALENRRLFQETQSRAEELVVLNEMSRALGSSLDVDAVIECVYRYSSRLMDTTNFYVALYDSELDEVWFPFYAEGDLKRQASRRRAGQGMTEYVLRSRQPLHLEKDVSARMRELGIEQIGQSSESWLGVPLTTGEETIGVVAVQSYTIPGLYSARERDLLIAIAGQTAIALQNARLIEETRARADELATLNEMSRTLSGLLSVEDVLEEAYRGASRLLDTTYFSIGLYDGEEDEFTLALHVDHGEMQKYLFTQQGSPGMSGYVLRTRKPLLIRENVREWQTTEGVEFSGIKDGVPPLSWLGAPLLVGDRVLGTMFVQSLTTPRLYDEHARDLMIAIASQVAVALENAHLFEGTQAALAEVEATHRSYLRRAWQDHLHQQEMLRKSAFLYDQSHSDTEGTWLAAPDLWRPEMELAVRQGEHVAAGSGSEQDRAGLAIPITVRGQTIGVLGVEAPADDRHWTRDDVALIEAISEQLAQTLENARLFADTQRRAERERLIGEITTKIRASTDMRDILETAAVELGRTLGTSRTLVRVGLEGLDLQRRTGPLPATASGPGNGSPASVGDE